MGSAYKRGRIWWVKYYRDGKPYRESTDSTRKKDSERLLKKREGAIVEGTFTGLRPEKTTLGELAQDLLNDYSINGKKAEGMVKYYVERLLEHFGRKSRVGHITTDLIRAYVAKRKQQPSSTGRPPANASINRELAALKRMLHLGRQAGKVVSVPHIPMLVENNVRKGFYTHHDYLRLKKVLPSYLKPVVTLGYSTGMRKAEILGLEWSQVNFRERVIRLDPGETKNDESRVVPISDECQVTGTFTTLGDVLFYDPSPVSKNAGSGGT